MAKEIADLYVFRSDSSNATYQTLQYVDGTLSCDCKGWIYKRNVVPGGERTCKHVRIVQAGMADEHAAKHVHYASVTIKVRVAVQQDLPVRRKVRAFEDVD